MLVIVYSIVEKKVRASIIDRDKDEIEIYWFGSVNGMKNYYKYRDVIYLRKYKNNIIKI